MTLQRSNVFAALHVCSCETRGGGVRTGVVHAGCKNNLCVREEYGLVFVLLAIPVSSCSLQRCCTGLFLVTVLLCWCPHSNAANTKLYTGTACGAACR